MPLPLDSTHRYAIDFFETNPPSGEPKFEGNDNKELAILRMGLVIEAGKYKSARLYERGESNHSKEWTLIDQLP